MVQSTSTKNNPTQLEKQVAALSPTQPFGKIVRVSGLVIAATGPEGTAIGTHCEILNHAGTKITAEVVGYTENEVLLMPFAPLEGVGPGCRVYRKGGGADAQTICVNSGYVGRIINALGDPIDDLGPLPQGGEAMPLKAVAPAPGRRQGLGAKLDVGVRALNTFIPLCFGQRMGVFSGSGVGKSTLMGMIAQYAKADVNVIALTGERGREVMEFIRTSLGEEGLKKSVLVVATGDEPPLMRRGAAYTAMAVAEYFRNQGKQVLFMMDSVTRFAMAQREIGLSIGEPPTTRGYTPSVFSELPRLLERAGTHDGPGAITALFTVLVEGGDLDEPVADAVRGILDGHIVMDRALAERGHFPAVNILKSVSRAMPMCHNKEENALVTQARKYYATFDDMAELIRLGAYQKGSDSAIDEAIHYAEPLEGFLRQVPDEVASLEESFANLETVLNKA